MVFGDVRDEQGAAVAAGLGEQSCRYTHHDVTSSGNWAAAVALAVEVFGRLDVLVNDGILTFASIADMPLARFAEPVEISRLVAYLASDESSYSTGSEFIADSGYVPWRARATDPGGHGRGRGQRWWRRPGLPTRWPRSGDGAGTGIVRHKDLVEVMAEWMTR